MPLLLQNRPVQLQQQQLDKLKTFVPLKRANDGSLSAGVVPRSVKRERKQVSSYSVKSMELDDDGDDDDDTKYFHSEDDDQAYSDDENGGGGNTAAGGRQPRKLIYSSTTSRIPLASRSLNLIKPVIQGAAKISVARPFQVPTFVKGDRPIGSLRPGTTLGITRRTTSIQTALYDHTADGAFILHEPKEVEPVAQMDALKAIIDPTKKVDIEVHVVVDPVLSRVLRPHQVEGVQFMYDCVTGKKKEGAYGCIMADEMGLGKTLQCKVIVDEYKEGGLCGSPIAGKPTIEKAIIACPSSLVKNWANELKKWLGPDRIRPYACDNKGTKEQTTRQLELFTNSRGRRVSQPVLIISYETLRNYADLIKKTEIGLLLCDEGHRLKNADSLLYTALNLLNAKRRIILSGTPIQNDLTEYFSLITFAIPDVLGTPSEFRRNFEIPILRGRDSEASDKEKEISEEKMKELLATANQFIIRRTAALLTKYLPIKYEYVVFCKMTDLQLTIYKNYVQSKEVRKMLQGGGTQQPLQAITLLKKLCNHPALLVNVEGGGNGGGGGMNSRSCNNNNNKKISVNPVSSDLDLSVFPPEFDFGSCQSIYSGKMVLLEKMVIKMRKETEDKLVIISNYTQTLDLIEKLCRTKRWGSLRLDGSMTIQKRQKFVDRFNDPLGAEFIFLLSSKAGGCGINLIGANRLILLDPDWNPATDLQALARVWRDGQRKTCFIYRFISTGSIEEKIFQRQAHKQSLSACVVDEEEDVERHFSLDAMKQLFVLNTETHCDTHDTFKCKRCVNGKQIKGPSASGEEGGAGGGAGATASDTSTWNHYSQLELGTKTFDPVLRECAKDTGVVSFVFQNKSHDVVLSKK